MGRHRHRRPASRIQSLRPQLEPVERRLLLTTYPGTSLGAQPWHATSTNLADVQNGPMANAGQDLINVCQALQDNGGDAAKLPGQFPLLMFQGDMVNVGVNGIGDYNTFLTSLRDFGMQISASDPTYMLAEGYLPISQLPAVAQAAQTLSLHPNDRPITQFVGAANNQGEASLQADTAMQQFGVDGTGVTIGVLSDTVNQAPNPPIPGFTNRPSGLAGSVQTGDLPNNVNVVRDGPAGNNTDEGRAMLENIHDIAPGASLAFATVGDNKLSMAQNIRALASASGAKVLVDDVVFRDEPFFQDGIVAQAINDVVVQNGVTYFSAAGNAGDAGYLSQFRPVTATIAGISPNPATYMNFNPGGGTTTQLPIITNVPDVTIVFQFDQPFKTQEPASSTAAPTSQLNFYVLDQTGKIVSLGGGDNNVAMQQPIQIVTVPNPGTYTVAVQLVSGPAPGHIEFLNFDNVANPIPMTVSQQFGDAGGTSYPTTYGHPTAQSAIGVGAVPWWATAPFLNQNPLQSEPFSSFGPALKVFDAGGNQLPAPVIIQAPVVSGPDGGNTSFFGQMLDTSNPPVRGEPATPTNLSQAGFLSFLGTSSAAPNVAAVATLMLQLNPNLTPAQIRSAMTSTTTPLNGAPGGTYTPQGGFGYVNAVGALGASIRGVNAPRVVNLSTVPGRNGVSTIRVTFSTPLDPRRAVNPLNYGYSVQIPGHNHRLGAPSSILVGLESVEYDAATRTVTLTTTTPIHRGTPILVIINQTTAIPAAGVGVADLEGILLDGRNNGIPGGVFMQTVIAGGPSVRPPTRHSSVEKGARLVPGSRGPAVGQTPHRARRPSSPHR